MMEYSERVPFGLQGPYYEERPLGPWLASQFSYSILGLVVKIVLTAAIIGAHVTILIVTKDTSGKECQPLYTYIFGCIVFVGLTFISSVLLVHIPQLTIYRELSVEELRYREPIIAAKYFRRLARNFGIVWFILGTAGLGLTRHTCREHDPLLWHYSAGWVLVSWALVAVLACLICTGIGTRPRWLVPTLRVSRVVLEGRPPVLSRFEIEEVAPEFEYDPSTPATPLRRAPSLEGSLLLDGTGKRASYQSFDGIAVAVDGEEWAPSPSPNRRRVCAICMDELRVKERVRKLRCGHIYHSDCIAQWLELNCSCPLCRCSAVGGPIFRPPKGVYELTENISSTRASFTASPSQSFSEEDALRQHRNNFGIVPESSSVSITTPDIVTPSSQPDSEKESTSEQTACTETIIPRSSPTIPHETGVASNSLSREVEYSETETPPGSGAVTPETHQQESIQTDRSSE